MENQTSASQSFLFTVTLTCVSRVIHVRDWCLGRVPRKRPACPGISATQHAIPSGKNLLDAVYVEPTSGPPRRAVLICHGIGEVVSQWFPIQRLLAENGIASLVFDYSGYGRSTGFIDWKQCELDAVSAYGLLRRLAPGVSVSPLGFSLGSGVAPAILDRIAVDRLVLCAAYSSFRSAARAAWVPGFLSSVVPPIWWGEKSLANCSVPVLVVQGEGDRLFRSHMSRDLVSYCAGHAELVVLPARSHNAPFYKPEMHYWGPIISWLLEEKPCRASA